MNYETSPFKPFKDSGQKVGNLCKDSEKIAKKLVKAIDEAVEIVEEMKARPEEDMK